MKQQLQTIGTGDGQSQADRFARELDPAFAKVEERTLAELIDFAGRLAEEIRFFDPATNTANGDWQPFFADLAAQLAANRTAPGSLPPHTALYVTFLRLLRHAKRRLNTITKRHLDFYYREILRFVARPPQPDSVHLLFTLKKNAARLLIPAGTRFAAGKDATGKPLAYALTDDCMVGHGTIAELRSLSIDTTDGSKTVRMAPKADSADGLGAPFTTKNPSWPPFGHTDLPMATPGFAVAAPTLQMAEGNRTIRLIFTLLEKPEAALPQEALEAHLTGAKGWIGPKAVTLAEGNDGNGQPTLTVTVELGKEDDGVVAYNAAVHGGTLATTAPVVQVTRKSSATVDYQLFEPLSLAAVRIEVVVSGVRQLTLANDLGGLDAAKPFLPFGPQPEAGATLYLGCAEAFGKPLTELSLEITWQKVPQANLRSYHSYGNGSPLNNNYFSAKLVGLEQLSWQSRSCSLFADDNAAAGHTITFTTKAAKSAQAAAHSDLGISAKTAALARQQSHWATSRQRELGFLDPKAVFRKKASPSATTALPGDGIGLRLVHGFFHKAYQKAYTEAIVTFTKQTTTSPALSLPAEPYTPTMESLTLSYQAATPVVPLTGDHEDDFLAAPVELYQIGAFGSRREHGFLKKRLSFAVDPQVLLFPAYPTAGELLIGIKNVAPRDLFSFLVQAAEGSANPEREREEISWSVLVDNHWRPLLDTELVRDGSGGLLASGIVTVSIPAEATATNSLLPSGCYWLRATVPTHPDAVCRCIGVHANAGQARFVDCDNDPQHLRTPLAAASITKPVVQIGALKQVSQPYGSFGARMAEDDQDLYTRASERLRHKARALTGWDYERLVLENFPGIHKVKCLNHTAPDRDEAPGHVTVVVVPDCRQGNAFDPLAPKAELATLAAIETLLADRAGLFVTPHARNPLYEEITVALRVRFGAGRDFGFHKEQLNRALQQWLAPWAFGDGDGPRFGGVLRKSQLISFVEQLEYVDFITDVQLFQQPVGSAPKDKDVETAMAANPRAILVSAANHTIDPA